MSSSEADSSKIKKQIVIRYPFTFYEEVSRALIHYKTYRDNKKYFRALPVMDELIDYCNVDPISGKHLYEMAADEKTNYDLIDLPGELVLAFKDLYHGTTKEYDGFLGLKHLAPGTSIDDKHATVVIRKPMTFAEAYGDHPAQWTALVAGFAYKIQKTSPAGFPMTEIVPMTSWQSEEIDSTYTTEIPRSVWAHLFEKMWQETAPVCTRIERVIAKTLTDKGFKEGSVFSMPDMTDDPEDGFDPLELS